MSADWSKPVRLHEIARGPVTLDFAPDEAQRAKVAKDLGLEGLPALKAQVTVRPWLDGAEVSGRFQATVEQICSVTLEPFEQTLSGDIHVRAVPAGSPHAAVEEGGEVELDPDAEDPPDVLQGDAVDAAGYVVEHLALEVDPFPRRPGAEFEYTPTTQEESPFAVLKKLKDTKD